MTKKNKQKQSSSKKAATAFGSMGRVLFFSIALVIACCAVAVVLFETEAGQEFVAKVRGDVSAHDHDETSSSPSSSEEKKTGDFAGQGSEARSEEDANAEQDTVPDGDSPRTPGTEKDTSSKVADDFNEGDRTVEDTSRREGASSDEYKVEEDTGEETFMDERAAETSHEGERNMENESQKLDDEPAVSDVSGSEDSNVEEEEDEEMRKTWEELDKSDEEDNAENSNSDKETFDTEIPVGEETRDHVVDHNEDSSQFNERESFKELSIEDEEPSIEDKEPSIQDEKRSFEDEEPSFKDETPELDIESQQNVEEQLDEIIEEQQQEETVSVGDSLTGLEEERVVDMKETGNEEERWEPLAEPEGPPIDEYPRHARRGLRGDYGSKDCKDTHVNCKPWAETGECKKNPIWMEVNCKKSCDVCSCSDNNLQCSEWSKNEECKTNSDYMNENCMKSCEQC